MRPAILGALLFGIVPACSGVRRGFPIPGLRLSELLIVLLAVPVVVNAVRCRRLEWRVFDTLAVAYVAVNAIVCVIALARRNAELGTPELQTMLGPAAFFLLYRALLFLAPSVQTRRVAVHWALIASIPVSLLALLQAFDFPYAGDLIAAITGVDIRAVGSQKFVERATGPFPHWHALSGYTFMIFLLATATLFSARPTGRSAWTVTAQALACLAIAASASVTAMLGALLGAAALTAWQRPWRSGSVAWVWPLAAVVIACGLFVGAQRIGEQQRVIEGVDRSGEVPLSVAYRGAVWRELYFPVIKENWVVGYGPGIPRTVTWPYTESIYVTYLLRGGVILLAVYLALMWGFAHRGWAAAHRGRGLRRMCGQTLVVAVVLLIPMHLLTTYFVSAGLPYLIWGLAALASPLLAEDNL